MQANQNAQLSGGCNGFPGASEQKYVVQGQTFRYRRYLNTIGLWWDSSEYGWTGRLSSGRAWYLREKLGLEVIPAGQNTPYKLSDNMPKGPIRLGKVPKRPTKVDGQETRWEDYSAVPVKTRREAGIREGLNINDRKCYWGCELCQSCMECVSNIEENDIVPHPDLWSWDDDETNERRNAVMPVAL